jgi:hypothetical protein
MNVSSVNIFSQIAHNVNKLDMFHQNNQLFSFKYFIQPNVSNVDVSFVIMLLTFIKKKTEKPKNTFKEKCQSQTVLH